MNAFYGFCSYLWLSLAVCNGMNDNGLWEMMWMTLFVVVFSYVGRGIIYMVEFVYKMQNDPAFFNQVMDGYMYYIFESQEIRNYLDGHVK